MLNFKRSFLLGCMWGILGFSSLLAQSQLERISITERGDGNGYVLRFHLSDMVDSYDVIQPETNRVQVRLFSTGLNTIGILMPELNEEITDLELHRIEGGIGVDIKLAENLSLIGEVYPDQNMKDLLLNLEYSSPADIEAAALESDLHPWSVLEGSDSVEEEKETSEVEQESTVEERKETENEQTKAVVGRESVSVKIGIAAGLGVANKLGGGYEAESRQEFMMGISAAITLPFRLRADLETGIETGIFFAQKGFLNPSKDRFGGTSVYLDYVEVPILARVRYDALDKVKPKVVGGFYTAFRANAESIESDGDRNDLKDVTKAVDVGLMAGGGVDFLINETNLSFQARYGIGLPPLFKGDFSGNERPGYLSLLMAIRF